MTKRRFLSWTIFLAAAAGPLLGALGRWNWLFDLFSHFRLQQALLLAAACLFFLWRREPKKIAASALLAAYCLLPVFPYLTFLKIRTSIAGPQETAILVSNVHIYSHNFTKASALTLKNDPGIAVFLETGREWVSHLEKDLGGRYAQSKVVVREDGFGIAVFSRIPMKEMEVRYLGRAQVPSIRCVFDLGGRETVLWATHPLPPVGAAYWRLRNEHLEALAEEVARETRPTILAGDLNTTPWNRWFRILTASRLRDSALHSGLQATWPSMWAGIFRVPLDHVLVSPEIQVLDRRVLEGIGSDHFPVLTKLGV